MRLEASRQKINIIRSKRSGENYGKYNESGQRPGHLQTFSRIVVYVHITLCQPRLDVMVWKKGIIGH